MGEADRRQSGPARTWTRRRAIRMAAWAAAAALLLAGGLYAWRGVFSAGGGRPAFRHVHGLAVDPYDPARLYVATHDGLWIWRESEGWQGRVGPRIDLMGFSVGARPGELFSSGHPGPGTRMPNPVGLIRSRDGGRTWDTVSLAGEVDFHALAVSPSGPGHRAGAQRVYGFFYGDGLFYRSDDGGRTWVRQRVDVLAGPDGQGPLRLVAHPDDPDVLLAAGEQGLLRSTNAGRSWEALLPGPVTAAAFVPSHPGRILAYVPQRGLVASRDGGRSWQELGRMLGERDAV